MGKADPCGPERRGGCADPASIAPVAGKRQAAGGKLNPDLVGTAGVQDNPQQTHRLFRLSGGFQKRPFAAGIPDAFADPVHNKGFVGPGIMVQQVFTGSGRSVRNAGDNGQVFLYDAILRKKLLHRGAGARRTGEDTGAAGRPVQPVCRIDFEAFLLPEQVRQAGRLGRDPDRLFADEKRTVRE